MNYRATSSIGCCLIQAFVLISSFGARAQNPEIALNCEINSYASGTL